MQSAEQIKKIQVSVGAWGRQGRQGGGAHAARRTSQPSTKRSSGRRASCGGKRRGPCAPVLRGSVSWRTIVALVVHMSRELRCFEWPSSAAVGWCQGQAAAAPPRRRRWRQAACDAAQLTPPKKTKRAHTLAKQAATAATSERSGRRRCSKNQSSRSGRGPARGRRRRAPGPGGGCGSRRQGRPPRPSA